MQRPPDLHVVDEPASAVAALLADQARRGGSLVLTGGSSVGEAYEQAAGLQPDWGAVTLWWGDERCVPPDDELSNYRLARETLLDRLAVPPQAVHRMRGELAPADAAAEYDAALEGVELELLLLGLGSDGHMASLFPGSPQLAVEDRRATSGPPGLDPFVDRVTMTVPTIVSARRIVFLVSGEEKADAAARAFGGEISRDVPASLARLAQDSVQVFLDPAAASKLEST
ncbi:MAG TPA: 6-phosphogluconolactonase [Gaiellaceae bacterium]|nr:6-phosphogluconolactonase [Gaiellaceae bacterium]